MTAKPKPAAKASRPRRYEAWKADKIRARLNNYRIDRATGAKPLPLRAVLDWMEACPVMPKAMLGRGGEIRIEEEWLRRFTFNKSGLIYARIDALRLFLIYEGFLIDEELDDTTGDEGESLALHAYLGATAAAARERLRALPDPFVIATRRTFNTENITLELTKAAEPGLFLVEELFISQNRVLTRSRDFKDPNRQRLRRGYAFFSTRMNLLHVFLRGASPADRVHYMEVEPFISPEGSFDLYLVRLGIPWRTNTVSNQPVFRGGTLTPENCSVLKFAPPEAQSPGTAH